jgi:phytoene/squalene synthetase
MLRDLWVDRDRPNLEQLRAQRTPERFVWAVLPHAARTFSACIIMLPAASAKAAAVGYLYCRILDTYEDLAATPEQGRQALRAFARRFNLSPEPTQIEPAPQLAAPRTVDERDQAHLLLIERCQLIDQVFLSLPSTSRSAIVKLIRDMAGGMIWAKRVFEEQGGVLRGPEQLRHYCNGVLGNPVAFTMRLMLDHELSSQERQIAMDVGEMIQLANVTRDIEKDLRHQLAYHQKLLPYLGQDLPKPSKASGPLNSPPGDLTHADKPEPLLAALVAVHEVRSEIFDQAMQQAPAYRKLVQTLPFRRWSLSRASAVLMLDFTDRYYSGCAQRLGRPAWPGPRNSLLLVLGAFLPFFSRRIALQRVAKVERAFQAARNDSASKVI